MLYNIPKNKIVAVISAIVTLASGLSAVKYFSIFLDGILMVLQDIDLANEMMSNGLKGIIVCLIIGTIAAIVAKIAWVLDEIL